MLMKQLTGGTVGGGGTVYDEILELSTTEDNVITLPFEPAMVVTISSGSVYQMASFWNKYVGPLRKGVITTVNSTGSFSALSTLSVTTPSSIVGAVVTIPPQNDAGYGTTIRLIAVP